MWVRQRIREGHLRKISKENESEKGYYIKGKYINICFAKACSLLNFRVCREFSKGFSKEALFFKLSVDCGHESFNFV